MILMSAVKSNVVRKPGRWRKQLLCEALPGGGGGAEEVTLNCSFCDVTAPKHKGECSWARGADPMLHTDVVQHLPQTHSETPTCPGVGVGGGAHFLEMK